MGSVMARRGDASADRRASWSRCAPRARRWTRSRAAPRRMREHVVRRAAAAHRPRRRRRHRRRRRRHLQHLDRRRAPGRGLRRRRRQARQPRASSSKCGSADVLEALGVAIELPHEAVATLIDEVGFGFLFAPNHHPAMRHAGPVRRELGVPTVMNLLGPLTNPVGVRRAGHRRVAARPGRDVRPRAGAPRRRARAGRARRRRLDELTPAGVCRRGDRRGRDASASSRSRPGHAGLRAVARPRSLRGGNAADNAAIVRAIFAGERGPRRDAVAPQRRRRASSPAAGPPTWRPASPRPLRRSTPAPPRRR